MGIIVVRRRGPASAAFAWDDIFWTRTTVRAPARDPSSPPLPLTTRKGCQSMRVGQSGRENAVKERPTWPGGRFPRRQSKTTLPATHVRCHHQRQQARCDKRTPRHGGERGRGFGVLTTPKTRETAADRGHARVRACRFFLVVAPKFLVLLSGRAQKTIKGCSPHLCPGQGACCCSLRRIVAAGGVRSGVGRLAMSVPGRARE